jgi:gamma-glutamylcyclotransferase (GGCT)/AIG2-like uncharacterized protein YtfP
MLYFIYGTLKRDFSNNYVLEGDNAVFIKEVKTKHKYPLYIDYMNYPCLINFKGKGNIIKGELWDIPKDKVHNIDYFEGVPELYYSDNIEIDGYDNVLVYYSNHDVKDIGKLELLSEFL